MKPTQTWNQHVVKKENKQLVLETIQNNDAISRADIAYTTGLNKGTVSSLVSELIEEHFIYESGPGKSSGGRRPVMLHFNKIAGYSIGIDLGVNYLLGVLTDLQGNIYEEKLIKYKNLNFEEIKEKIFLLIDSLMSFAPDSPYGIVGIGIGVPGIVSNEGNILLAPNLGWKNIHLQQIVEERYHLPVIIENEANAGAYGEKKFGAGKTADNIIYVSVGIGIGVGMVLGGQLYRGINGFSGELGHMTIEVDGKECRCGNRGCWELYASEQVLEEEAQKSGLLDRSVEFSLESLLVLADEGNQETIALFENVGDYLGVGLNNIVNIFNPDLVLIGNRMASAEKWLSPSLSKRLDQILSFQKKDLSVAFSELSTHSSALGMAAFTVENFHTKSFQQN